MNCLNLMFHVLHFMILFFLARGIDAKLKPDKNKGHSAPTLQPFEIVNTTTKSNQL